MGLSAEAKRERQIERAKAARQRAWERQIAKQNDPDEIEKRQRKQQEASARALARQQAKQNDPEFQKKKIERAKIQQEKAREKARSKPPAAKTTKRPVKKVVSKGLKGRSPTVAERQVMDKIGSLPCLACLLKGRVRPLVSLHHMDGRTKPHAHAMVLPLCAEHHDTPAEKAVIEQYPDLLPYHARGNVGGKAAWRRHNGDEWVMLAIAYHLVGMIPDFELVSLSSEQEQQIEFVLPLLS